ncbi:MAG TPA: tripartite tricarboxylate transporter substrate-binding protein, partial [Thermodesulfobacteriota bacterium]|nr:tripartite tricarboxylate transporter substrate-binding protein [Thermodesulfobacteriota bacterium]
MAGKNFIIVMLSIFFGAFAGGGICNAQTYPNKPIELLIPWSAGGATDIIGRLFAKYASQRLGQPIVVTNKTGAGGILATAELVKSPPDGYKILLQSISFHVIQAKTEKLPFSPSLVVPVANFTEGIQGCVVKADSPFKTFN